MRSSSSPCPSSPRCRRRPVAEPRLAPRGPHRHRRFQPHHRRRHRHRSGVRRLAVAGADLESAVPPVAGPLRPARPAAAPPRDRRTGRSARQLALARRVRPVDPLPARAADLGSGRRARRIADDRVRRERPDHRPVPPDASGLAAAVRAAASRRLPRAGRRGRSRPHESTTCSGATPRFRPMPRRFWSTRASTSPALPAPPARSTTSAGISAPPASGCCICPTAPRSPTGCRSGSARRWRAPSSAGPTASGPRRIGHRPPKRPSRSSRAT